MGILRRSESMGERKKRTAYCLLTCFHLRDSSLIFRVIAQWLLVIFSYIKDFLVDFSIIKLHSVQEFMSVSLANNLSIPHTNIFYVSGKFDFTSHMCMRHVRTFEI